MNHPKSCRDPQCRLSYREHLLGISISAAATPTRRPGTMATNIREGRWHRDMDAYKRLRSEGFQPPHVDGARLRERQGKTAFDIEKRPVTIDYGDPA